MCEDRQWSSMAIVMTIILLLVVAGCTGDADVAELLGTKALATVLIFVILAVILVGGVVAIMLSDRRN